jgi:hypothetical protein
MRYKRIVLAAICAAALSTSNGAGILCNDTNRYFVVLFS